MEQNQDSVRKEEAGTEQVVDQQPVVCSTSYARTGPSSLSMVIGSIDTFQISLHKVQHWWFSVIAELNANTSI